MSVPLGFVGDVLAHRDRPRNTYPGSPIRYGLGHFVFDLRIEWTDEFMRTLAGHRTARVVPAYSA